MRRSIWLLLAACATAPVVPRERIAGLKEAEETDVAACRPVGRFEGDSALAGEAGMAQARDEVRAKAAAAGATHIVVVREFQNPDVAGAVVKAYACP